MTVPLFPLKRGFPSHAGWVLGSLSHLSFRFALRFLTKPCFSVFFFGMKEFLLPSSAGAGTFSPSQKNGTHFFCGILPPSRRGIALCILFRRRMRALFSSPWAFPHKYSSGFPPSLCSRTKRRILWNAVFPGFGDAHSALLRSFRLDAFLRRSVCSHPAVLLRLLRPCADAPESSPSFFLCRFRIRRTALS